MNQPHRPDVRLKRVRPHAVLPRYMSEQAAGMDLSAATEEPVTIPPGGRTMVPTGWAMAVPPGYEAQVRPRSGLARRQGITVLNAPGTIDADYRGEVQVLLVNTSDTEVILEAGERIAQLVIAPVARATMSEVDELEDTERGTGGFGSTGRGTS